MYFVIMFIVIACMGVLILPFVGVYTINLTDVQYVRPYWNFIYINCFYAKCKDSSSDYLRGRAYKETRYQAILEAVINITVSLGLVWKFGMAGFFLVQYVLMDIALLKLCSIQVEHGKRMCKKIYVPEFLEMYLSLHFFVLLEYMLFLRI